MSQELEFTKIITKDLEESITLKKIILRDFVEKISKAASIIINSYRKGGKTLLIGNGGSAADAQHIAAELIGRFQLDRAPLPSIALTTDSSVLTALSNDFDYQNVFSRQIEALAKENDVLIALSTSGKSANIIEAVKTAKQKKIKTIGLLGSDGGSVKDYTDIDIIIPSQSPARVQEAHITIGHILCNIIEQEYFKNE